MKEDDAILDLGCKFVPQLDGELAIGGAECADESIFEGLDHSLCCVYSVVVCFYQLQCHLLRDAFIALFA
jgi:hypothetical protein